VSDLMEGRGWSLGKLAERSGLDKSYLSRLRRGKYASPGEEVLRKLAGAFEVTVSDLIGETEPAPQVAIYSGVAWVPYVERSVHAGADGWRAASSRGRTPLSEAEAEGHKRLYAGRVTGECMLPDVQPGATVIWDPDMRHPVDGQPVVVSLNGDLMVKLAYHDADGGYLLVSHDGQEVRPNGLVLEGVVVKVTNDPQRGPRSLADFRRERDMRINRQS
jgi:transcriptional regulator with XRE-family HTH domain